MALPAKNRQYKRSLGNPEIEGEQSPGKSALDRETGGSSGDLIGCVHLCRVLSNRLKLGV